MGNAAGAGQQITSVLAVTLRWGRSPGELHLVKCIWLVEGRVEFGDTLEDDQHEEWVVVKILESWEAA